MALIPLLASDAGEPDYLVIEEALSQGAVDVTEAVAPVHKKQLLTYPKPPPYSPTNVYCFHLFILKRKTTWDLMIMGRNVGEKGRAISNPQNTLLFLGNQG